MEVTVLESVAAALTSTGEVTVEPFAGVQIVTVRLVGPGVHVAALAVNVTVESRRSDKSTFRSMWRGTPVDFMA